MSKYAIISDDVMLKDKVVIVTGASSGIGRATAIALASHGCKVAIGARRTSNLEKLQDEIEKSGGQAFAQKLDVSDRQNCNSFVNEVLKKWNTIDVLVNNAGLMPLSFFKNLKYEEWDQMIDVNIKGVLYCTGAVINHMKSKKSGHIVNISSVAGRIVFPSGSVYCATKHAVTALSEGLRQEFSTRSNIRVTCIELVILKIISIPRRPATGYIVIKRKSITSTSMWDMQHQLDRFSSIMTFEAIF